jgi:hypothetical protein
MLDKRIIVVQIIADVFHSEITGLSYAGVIDDGPVRNLPH